jgi:hypothetical protein
MNKRFTVVKDTLEQAEQKVWWLDREFAIQASIETVKRPSKTFLSDIETTVKDTIYDFERKKIKESEAIKIITDAVNNSHDTKYEVSWVRSTDL